MRDQKFIDDAEEHTQRASQTKTNLTPKTILTCRSRRVLLRDLRRRFDTTKDIAREIIPRQRQQRFDRSFRIDLDEAIRQLRLPESHNFIKTLAQTFFCRLIGRV